MGDVHVLGEYRNATPRSEVGRLPFGGGHSGDRRLVSKKQMAAMLGVCTKTLDRHVNRGWLVKGVDWFYVGSVRRFDPERSLRSLDARNL